MGLDWEAVLGTSGAGLEGVYDDVVSTEMYRVEPDRGDPPRSLPFEEQ